jgi:potassium-transporting ATPase KdpC subunit
MRPLKTIVAGMGNTIRSNDGVGVHAMRRLQANPEMPSEVGTEKPVWLPFLVLSHENFALIYFLWLFYEFLSLVLLFCYWLIPRMNDSGEPAQPIPRARLGKQLRPAILSALVLTIVTGGVFPLLLFAIARPLLPRQVKGSLLAHGNQVVGSALIGQEFTRSEYFQSRPSAAGSGYDGSSSGGTNLGPNNPKLIAQIRELAEQYRKRNGLPPDTPVPIDAVTRSASGLDPHISPANAELQIPRVARARGLSEDVVRRLVSEYTEARQLGFLGNPRVTVLELNLALDRIAPAHKPYALD